MARGNDGKNFLGESDYQAFIEGLRTVRQHRIAAGLSRFPGCGISRLPSIQCQRALQKD
jgi:hypothetical protein